MHLGSLNEQNRPTAWAFAADPLVGSIATQYLQNREEHDRIARLWTKRYATWFTLAMSEDHHQGYIGVGPGKGILLYHDKQEKVYSNILGIFMSW